MSARAFYHFYSSRPGKFIEALFSGKLISQQSLDQMTGFNPCGQLYLQRKTFYGHTGGVDGFGFVAGITSRRKTDPPHMLQWKVMP